MLARKPYELLDTKMDICLFEDILTVVPAAAVAADDEKIDAPFDLVEDVLLVELPL